MKLTEKELNKFPIGTKIYTSGIVYLKLDINKFRRDCWEYTNKEIIGEDVYKVEIPTYTKYIQPKPILDDIEKEYLSNLIMPWKNKIGYIEKRYGSDKEWIEIYLKKGNSYTNLPCFKKGTMYKGMKLDREYMLEELGL